MKTLSRNHNCHLLVLGTMHNTNTATQLPKCFPFPRAELSRSKPNVLCAALPSAPLREQDSFANLNRNKNSGVCTQQHEPLYQHYCLLLSTNPPEQTVHRARHTPCKLQSLATLCSINISWSQQVSFCAPGKEVLPTSQWFKAFLLIWESSALAPKQLIFNHAAFAESSSEAYNLKPE